MGTNTKSQGWARWMAVATVAGGMALTGAAASQAAGLPAPSAPASLPAPPAPLSGVLSTSQVQSLLSGATPPALPGASLPAPPSLPVPAPSAPAGGTSTGSTGGSTGSTGSTKTGSTKTGTTTTGSSTTGGSTSSSPGAVRATTPVASVCLIPTGTSSPAFDLGLTALGQDLSSPLVQHFPQAFAPCPAGASSSPDQVAAVDASVNGLLGACVRVTRQVAPIQTTLVVLNHNLIQELTAAGVPLQQLVVPCPAGAGADAGAPAASAGQSGSGSLVNSALAGDDLGDPAGQGRLAFTGIDLVPSLALAGALLWAGTLLLRASRRFSGVARG